MSSVARVVATRRPNRSCLGDDAPPPAGESTPPADPATTAGEPDDEALETAEARRRAAERGDPFDTGEYRARRAAGRPRHRDLPAKVRRRQDFAVAGLVILVLVGAYLLFFSGGGDDNASDEGTSIKRLAGQTLIGKLPGGGADKKLLKRVKKGQLGGVIVSTDKESQVAKDAKALQAAAAARRQPAGADHGRPGGWPREAAARAAGPQPGGDRRRRR